MNALQANQKLRRAVDQQLRRRLSRAKSALERIDALYASHALRHKLADRSVDLELQQLEREVGLEPAEELPWPRTDAPIVDNTPQFRSRLAAVAAAVNSRPTSAK